MRPIWKFVSATGFFLAGLGMGRAVTFIISSLFAENPGDVSLSPIIMKGVAHDLIGHNEA
jgi:hypothetical protein